MTQTQKFLYDLYLSSVNDFLTMSSIAEAHGLSDNHDLMRSMIEQGKIIYEDEMEHIKICHFSNHYNLLYWYVI